MVLPTDRSGKPVAYSVGLNYMYVSQAPATNVPGRDRRGLIYPILSY